MGSAGYTPTGPFVSGTAPGLSAALFNNVEGVLEQLNSLSIDPNITANGSGVATMLGLVMNGAIQANPGAHVLTGSTSGTATLYEIMTGTCKMFYIIQNNFRNGSAGSQFIPFPTTISSICFVMTGDSGSFNLTSSGSPVTLKQFSSFGTLGTLTNVGSAVIAQSPACDSIAFLGSQAGAHTGPVLIFGV
jgi:hypothetical protein